MRTPPFPRKHAGSHLPPARQKPHPGRRVSFSEKENAMVVKLPSKNLVMEEVKILKRGEDLSTTRSSSNGEVSALCSTRRLGPEPDAVPSQIRFVAAAATTGGISSDFTGSGFDISPAPSALPFPALLLKGTASI
ncbi:hypothetical protein J5N97_027014 [Dioscorea zingiberensis]|uniref:Uncharacterized protein n=1 Tax=Dioscorea zingiberensis TaxID=325984 RepID=A0A9D5C373_9LILI|nr:hypothetical protein J5N97_027014 [Dioscorea zingiberensis]